MVVNLALEWPAEVVEDVAVVRSKQALRRTRGPVQLEVPTLDMFDTPTRLASEYDVRRTFARSCMEWAVHRGDVDAARTLLKRYLDAHP